MLKGSDILLLQGQEVTLDDAEAADRMGILSELYRATGGSLTANISHNLQAAMESTSNRIQSTTQNSVANLRRSAEIGLLTSDVKVEGRDSLITISTFFKNNILSQEYLWLYFHIFNSRVKTAIGLI